MKTILIAPAHYRTYRSASRRLSRLIGTQAPTAEQLIRRELAHRTPRLIADEYLDYWRRVPQAPVRLACRLNGLKIPAVDPRRN